MTDDGNAPTIPDSQAPAHGPSHSRVPRSPDERYVLRALLGQGGMGEVWLAHDLRIDREIAIKLMRGGGGNSDAVARFLREARVQGRLEHPSVVPVHDLGGDESSPFFAMKRLTGTNLHDVIAAHDDDKWPRRVLLSRFVDVCLAIEFAHKRGVIHRDLKPANIVLGDFGETYVIDWGLARIADTVEPGVIRKSDLRGDTPTSGQTGAGAILGTPGYMAPEQMRGEPIDARADVYALGCILFEILCGEPAIPRDRSFEVTLAANSHRPLERNPTVPPELDETCARATAARCDDRLSSARELADAVQRFLDGDRDLARRRALAATHVGRARELLASESITARGEAMREAGSAIALDANNRDAQAVLARLLIEPPKEIPADARRAIDAERQDTTFTVLRRGLVIYLVTLLIAPIAQLLGVANLWPLVVFTIEIGALVALCAITLRRRWPIKAPLVMTFATLHMVLLVTAGIALGSMLVLPFLIFGTLPLLLMNPAVRIPRTVFMLHAIALGVPLSLEGLSLVPRSFSLQGSKVVLEPWALTVSSQALMFVVAALLVVQLVGNTIVLDALRRAQDRAQEQLHLQKWHLDQLVRSTTP